MAKLGVSFDLRRKKKTLDEQVDSYIDWVKAHDGQHPSRNVKDDVERNLGVFAGKMRRKYRFMKEGKTFTGNMSSAKPTQEQIDKLKAIGFRWEQKIVIKEYTRPQKRSWDEQFELLKAYKEKHGHCEPLFTEPVIGTFAHTQRKQYKFMLEGKKNGMSMERLTKLSELGFRFKTGAPGHRRRCYVKDIENKQKGKDKNEKEDEANDKSDSEYDSTDSDGEDDDDFSDGGDDNNDVGLGRGQAVAANNNMNRVAGGDVFYGNEPIYYQNPYMNNREPQNMQFGIGKTPRF